MQAKIIFGALLLILCAGIAALFSIFMSVLVGLSAGLGALILGGGFYAYFSSNSSQEKWLSLGAISLGGIILGASVGAIVGSLVPGPGTLVCAALGGLIGLVLPLTSVFLIEAIKLCCSTSFSTKSSSNYHWTPTNSFERTRNSFAMENVKSPSNSSIPFFPKSYEPSSNPSYNRSNSLGL